jgi:peptide/nickel transport system substrate-binding protein
MTDPARPVSPVWRRPALSALALAPTLLLPGCSTEGWEAPPSSGRMDGQNLELVNDLVDVMEQRGLWALEVEDASGVRVHIDRRAGGAAAAVVPAAGVPVQQAPGGAAGQASTTERSDVASSATDDVGEAGPGAAVADVFHPDNQPGPDGERPESPEALWGGRVIVHVPSLPKHTNYVTENSAYTRRFLYELHETLLEQDWEYHDFRTSLARDYTMEDMLILADGAEARYPQARQLDVRPLGFEQPFTGFVLFGAISQLDGDYRIEPLTEGGSALEAPLTVAGEDVLSIERGCAMTFTLREGVRWHPATGEAGGLAYSIDDQVLDADDVYFSWSIYSNPEVDCDEKRFQFEKMTDCEVLDDLTVRIFYREQYFQALESVGTSLTILPRHLYDLSDPDNPWYDPEASPSKQAKHINENPHNQLWVGLGPYRLVEWTQQYIEADRFDGYFEPDNAGYVDTIRWRLISDDNTAFQALLNGELDYFERVKSADYFGAATERTEFAENFYKGYKYLGTYGYTGWNSHRPYLSDKRVRQALAHAFPADEYLRTNYKNLARRITGPFPFSSAAYDHSLEPIGYDLEKARTLLEEAGYYDTDGNGIVDKDGRDLVIEFMMPSGNEASKNLGLVMQENFGKIGIKLEFASLEWAAFVDRMRKREFDGINLAWVPPLESDPEQVWHSKWGAPEVESSNNSGIQEPELDALILAGQREIDFEARQEIWKQIHRFLFDWQPYLFGYNVPNKFAMSKRLRGFKTYAIDPGYRIRDWYFVDPSEPGTRRQP